MWELLHNPEQYVGKAVKIVQSSVMFSEERKILPLGALAHCAGALSFLFSLLDFFAFFGILASVMKNPTHHLRNHLSKEEALEKLENEPFERKVISFYRYVRIADPVALRHTLFQEWNELGCLGRIYVSQEGINAQMSIPEPRFKEFQEKLYARKEFTDVPFKVGVEQNDEAFWKLAIKVRNQIVADGLKPSDYDVTNVGTHLSAKEFNEKIEEGAVVVDMRNNYESAIGKFEGAITPNAYTFREELPMTAEILKGKENEPVLLYCTGGIRCEKASSYLKHQGFKKVYQLLGGIIDYKHQVEEGGLTSKFKGKNFVFDDRMGERITEDVLGQCYHCASACDEYINCREEACNLLFIECPACLEKNEGFCSETCLTGKFVPNQEKGETVYRRSIALSGVGSK